MVEEGTEANPLFGRRQNLEVHERNERKSGADQTDVYQRLTHIESTVRAIQSVIMEEGEIGSERHASVVARLDDLQDAVAANKRLLREIKKGCSPASKQFVFCAALVLVSLWLYIVHNIM